MLRGIFPRSGHREVSNNRELRIGRKAPVGLCVRLFWSPFEFAGEWNGGVELIF